VWLGCTNFGAGWGASATCCAALQHDGQHRAPASTLANNDNHSLHPGPGDVLVPSWTVVPQQIRGSQVNLQVRQLLSWASKSHHSSR